MLCVIPAAIALLFFGYLFYTQYSEQTSESMTDKLTGSFNTQVSAAGGVVAVAILLCYVMGLITSTIATAVGIGAILGLDYMGYIGEESTV